MESTTLYTLLLTIALIFYLLSGFIRLLVRQALSPLSLLRGPPCPSFFMGNLMEMHDQENNNLVAEWEAAYGSTFVYRGFIGGCRLMTTDPVAVAHILGNAYDYPKPDFVRDSLATMAAGHDGLLTVEGDAHKRQRKILTPAFSSSHIKSLTPIFWDSANKLRDIWFHTAAQADGTETNESKSKSSIPRDTRASTSSCGSAARRWTPLAWLVRFGYHFNALTDDNNELAQAFGVIFSTARKFRVMTILQVWFPFLRRFRRNSGVMIRAHETMRRIGLELIEERSRAVIEEQREVLSGKSGEIDGDKTILGRDILSVLIRSNLATTANQKMSVNERKLRAALRDVERDLQLEHAGLEASDPQLYQQILTDRLSKCEYLDWIVRETLRLHAPITSTMRVCMRDEDEIPVSSEGANGEHGGGCLDKNGKRLYGIRVKKWDIITIPIQAINKSQALWGEDARAFKPERWAQPPSTAKAIPGLYSNTLTFLNGNPLDGNRACIGYKFALIEMKIFLYTLLKDIEFRQEASMVIEKKVNVVTRPFVKSEPELGEPAAIVHPAGLFIRRVLTSSTVLIVTDLSLHRIELPTAVKHALTI
ncbi:Cytochrome P450 [Mycena sanguinolenta]|uniref:Cytochrome P450 n=1 Tax=Mycena sanguinolenta TaxID=230812 RepID=A0A8H7D0P8_9AGAR|nr:Cytochrome P450 [Mycena sanguinolenta]